MNTKAKNSLRKIFLFALTMGIFSSAQAQQNFTFGGFADTYYAYDFNRPVNRERSYTTQPLRHNEFNLNFAFLDAKYSSENIRGRFALGTGTYMMSNYIAEPEMLKHIFEANAGFSLGGNTWLDAGIFASHIGFESAISKDNWTYSRSLMADYSPYYESGVKLTSQVTENFFAGIFLLNGWQNIRETNNDKAFGTQIQFRPSEKILLNWSSFAGNEMPDSASPRLRIFNDFYGQFSFGENIDLAAVFDFGMQEKISGDGSSNWYTGALIARYKFSPQWRMAVRGEIYNDKDGVIVATGTENNFQITGASLNLDYVPSENLLARIEGRMLQSKDEIFPTSSKLSKSNSFLVSSIAISF